MKLKQLVRFFLLSGLFASLPVWATDPVTDAMQQAYAPYRMALFRTNSKAQAESEQAMAQAQQAWTSVIDRFGAKAAVPYDRDAGFAATLHDVERIYETAAAEIAAHKLPQAHETLEQVRDLLAGLRQRNGVVVFSDHMNAYHAEMEHLLQHGEALTTSAGGVLLLMERVGVLGYLTVRLRSEAPKALSEKPEFSAALQGVEASVAALRKAVLEQDAAAARKALGELKKPYSQMFLKFG
jgi:hypothetical protein